MRKRIWEIAEMFYCPIAGVCLSLSEQRQFIKRYGGKVKGVQDYGYKYNGNGNLSHLVDRSDVVICPVDVNSHSACLRVKKCCKELNKPYYMLRNSSISTIHQTLTQVAAMSN